MIKHAVILAAGMGTRLKPITNSAPKCLTEVNGTPILMNTLNNMSTAGIRECSIVVGHFADLITETVGDSYGSMTIEYITNEMYRQTNDMYSLWLARNRLEAGAVVVEGDIFFRADLLPGAFSRMTDKSFYIAGGYDGRSEEILIVTNDQKRIISIDILKASALPGPNRFMSSGLLVVNDEYGKRLSGWLSHSVQRGDIQVLFDDVVRIHIDEYPLYIHEITHNDWVEIDTLDDLKRAERIFSSHTSSADTRTTH